MSNNIDYTKAHYCPIYKAVIEADLCYDSLMCLNGSFKVSSTKELNDIKDIEVARTICENCKYSEL